MNHNSRVGELSRHRLADDGVFQLAPLKLHVDCALLAHRTLVVNLHVRVIAVAMHIVTAFHGDNVGGGSKHVVLAYGAISIGSAFDTPVVLGIFDANADVAPLKRRQRRTLDSHNINIPCNE